MELFPFPFFSPESNKFVCIESSPDPAYLLVLPEERIGHFRSIVYDKSILDFEQASAGFLLVREFGEIKNIRAVPHFPIRQEWKKHDKGNIYSTVSLSTDKTEVLSNLQNNNHAHADFQVSLYDSNAVHLMQSTVSVFLFNPYKNNVDS